MKIIILALLISTLIISGCAKTEDYIKNEIEKANHCNTKQDCIDAGGKCPFGCYVYVNKNEVDRISNLISSYRSNCIYSCILCQDVACENNMCEPVC